RLRDARLARALVRACYRAMGALGGAGIGRGLRGRLVIEAHLPALAGPGLSLGGAAVHGDAEDQAQESNEAVHGNAILALLGAVVSRHSRATPPPFLGSAAASQPAPRRTMSCTAASSGRGAIAWPRASSL